MSRPRVLIVEDERGLTQALEYSFDKEGYDVLISHDGVSGLQKAQTVLPDVVILDLMLPGMSGLDVCRELRRKDETRSIPILMLTARSEESDQLVGFTVGADDYVTKPFSSKVLVQRVKALHRRTETTPGNRDQLEYEGICIDHVRHQVTVDGEPVELTPTEYRLLECLLKQPGRAFNRYQLMQAAIGDGSIVLERTIDVHIKTLRKKIGDSDKIETVRGVGYRFREAQPN